MTVLKVSPDYDSRLRPWYTAPVATGGATWSEIYPFFAELGIAASQPVYDEEGNLLRVLVTELALLQLGDSRANVQNRVQRRPPCRSPARQRSGWFVSKSTYPVVRLRALRHG